MSMHTRDRQRSDIRSPSRYRYANLTAFALNVAEEINELVSYEQAINSPEKERWKQAVKEEIDSLLKNQTWDLIKRPQGQRLVSCKWIFKYKEGIQEWKSQGLKLDW